MPKPPERRSLAGRASLAAFFSGLALLTFAEASPVPPGIPVTEEDIAAWNIDVRRDGAGLPEGRGSAVEGRRIFEFGPTGLLPKSRDGIVEDPAFFLTCPGGPSKCALCHGAGGRNGNTDNSPQLVGGRWPECPPRYPVDVSSGPPTKTVGSYWPLATTLFDYIRRAMPFDCPGSLTDDEVYAVTAYILYLNGIVNADEVLDAETLPAINRRMPNHRNFFQVREPYFPKAEEGPDHGRSCKRLPGASSD